MANKRCKQIVTPLCQIEVGIANGKTTPKRVENRRSASRPTITGGGSEGG
jgi:hypothetical protein